MTCVVCGRVSTVSLQPCTVTTHTVPLGDIEQTVYVIEFAPEISAREA